MPERTIHCPCCSTPMVVENFGSAEVDVCAEGCGGLWLDEGELERLDGKGKGAGPALRRAARRWETGDSLEVEVDCPLCDVEMRRFPHPRATDVTIDQCRRCKGVFLEAGELFLLRSRKRRPELIEEPEPTREERGGGMVEKIGDVTEAAIDAVLFFSIADLF